MLFIKVLCVLEVTGLVSILLPKHAPLDVNFVVAASKDFWSKIVSSVNNDNIQFSSNINILVKNTC